MLFTVSAVNAVDSEIQAISAHNSTDTVVGIINDDNLKMNVDVESLGDGETDAGTYMDLNTKINNASEGGTVYLENNYTFSDVSRTSGIQIPYGMTIDGKGHSIDAQGKGRIFLIYLDGDHDVTFKNIIFLNGSYAQRGGAIYSAPDGGDGSIINCTFINNQVTGNSYGGAVSIYAGIKNIINSTFIDCSAPYGGAIQSQFDPCNVVNCTFIDNKATYYSDYGGAIYLESGIISDSIFINNPDVPIYSYGTVTANNNWFGNTIDNFDVAPSIDSVTVDNWYVLDLDIDHNGVATVSLNNLYENGILDKSNTYYNLPPITVNVKGTNVDIDENVTLDKTGKATIAFTPTDSYSITVTYKNIKLTKEMKPSFTYLNSLINNLQTQTLDLEDDFEYYSDSDSALSGGILLEENIIIDGHGHYIDAKGQSCIFNVSDDSKNLVLKNIRFSNAKGLNGAVVYFKGNKIEIINCTFENNSAENEGDAVYIAGINEASSIDKCVFINNKGTNSVIYIGSDNVQFDIKNSIFLNNTGLNIKGADNVVATYNWFGHNASNYDDNSFANVDGRISLNNYLFLNISYTSDIITISLNNLYDGNVGSYDDCSVPSVKLNVKNENLTVGNNAIIAENGKCELDYAINALTGSLTAYYEDISYTKDIAFIDDGSFSALQLIINTAQGNIINLERNYTYNPNKDSALVTGITFTKPMTIIGKGNVKIDAKDMARIINVNQDITFRNISFVNGNVLSLSSDRGAAIYNNGGNCRFINCSFINNTAYQGGAIYNSQNTLNQFENCTFINNTATSQGGVINNYQGFAKFIDSIFVNNSATSSGGVYFADWGGYDYYDNCTFINNSAKMSAVISSGTTGTTYDKKIINSTFIGNRIINGSPDATTNAIIWSYVTAVEGCIFNDNTAASIIYEGFSNFVVKNSIFLNNTANYVITGSSPSSITADYNWFGNNVTNYNVRPNLPTNLVLNNWYVLNITANKFNAIISLNNLYDGSDVQKDYADYALPNITLDIKSINLNVQNNVTLNKTGKTQIPFTLTSDRGLLSLTKGSTIMSKEIKLGDFDLLQQLVNENDVVELTRDYAYDLDFDIITEGVLINKPNLVINGNGFTIDAKGKSRIFKITESGVTINNVTFINAKYDSEGGAIYGSGDNSTITSSLFANNTATTGSAVYLTGSNGKINDCIFVNNHGDNDINAPSDLNADYNWFGNNASNYNINIAKVEGFTLNNWYFLNMTLAQSSANIDLNNVYVVLDQTNVTNDNCALPNVNFTLAGENVTVQNDIVINQNGNVSITPLYKDLSLTASFETASYTANKTLQGDFAILQQLINEAGVNGEVNLTRNYNYIVGADTGTEGIEINCENLTINGNGFTINAKGKSRIFKVNSEAKNLVIKNINFINGNITEDIAYVDMLGGGAILVNEVDNVSIINSTFKNNFAIKGGAIGCKNSYIKIINSSFISNNVSNMGGAIHFQGQTGIIVNSTFMENSAYNPNGLVYGGVISCASSGTLNINDSYFINNLAYSGSSSAYAGVIYDTNVDVNINNSTFIDNKVNGKSLSYGGVIYWDADKLINISNSTFIHNTADGASSKCYGGVVYIKDGISNIVNSSFLDNHVKSSGGVFYAGGDCSNTITDSIFLNNTESSDLSVVSESSLTKTFTFNYCWFGNYNENDTVYPVPSGTGITVNNDLTLDIVHDEYMVVGEDRNVKFVYKYVAFVSGENKEKIYDTSKLPKLNLTLTTENGELNKYSALIGENLLFKGNQVGSASITGSTHGTSETEDFTVKYPTKIIVDEVFNSFVGDTEYFGARVVCSDGSELPSGVTYNWIHNENASYDELSIFQNYLTKELEFTGLKSGTYLVKITANLTSTSDYSNSSTTVTVIVSQIDKEILVGGPNEITYGNENIDMEVSLDISDETYLDKLTYDSQDSNILTVTNDGLMTAVNAGKTNITITYAGSDKYKATSKKVEITVKQAGSDVTVPDKEFVYGSDVEVTVTTINSTGDVSAVVLDEDGNVVSGAVVTTAGNDITVTGLNVGNYTLNVTTNDIHNNHYSVTRSATLNITKAGSDVTVPVSSSVVYGSSVTVVVTGLANATSVTASLFNDTVKVKDLVVNDDVNVVVDASGVDVGTYTLKVTTVTDSNHASVTREGSVVVGQAGSDATVPNSANVGYTESVDVVVSNPVNASGIRAKLYLGDDEVAGVVSVDGLKVTVNALSLNVGEYTLKVTTIPVDDNHASVTHECIVTVNKIDSEVSFIPNEITFAYEDEGSTIATCTGCTIDEENVTILNHPEANIVVDGNKITVSGLDEGEYTMNIITTPYSNYKSIETTLKVTVSGISPKMDMMVSNITVGEKLNVYITMDTEATGIVNITIFQGTKIIQSRNITINNRFNKTEFEGLKVGKYTITAFYYGSMNYNEVTVPDEFTVHPIYAFEFSAEVNDTVCGNTTNATVKLSPDATGSIQIGTVVQRIEDGVTVIELPVQNRAGKNNVTVKYIPEDSKYGPREIVVYYNVVKKPTEIIIADIGDVKAGDNVTVEVSSYPNAQIVVYLDGVKLDSNTIENISAGTHTIMANVAETSEYLSGTANKTFTVTKTDVEFSVSGIPTKVHEKSPVTVQITPGVTGTIIVNINGTDYVLDAANIKPIEVEFDKAGTASLSVKYLGDYKFNAKDAGEDIVISDKAQANIVVSDLPSDIKAGSSFDVEVSASSTVKVYVDGVERELVDGKVTVPNVAAGPHNITVVAAETPEYYGGEVIKTFEAVKEVATIRIADVVNKKAGDDVTVQVSAYDGAVIVVYVDGVERELVDGKVTVSNVAAGTHTIVASVDETYEYLSATANKTFEVTKNNVGIFSIVPQTEWDKTNITIQFTDAPDITGYVIMNINGTEYILNVSDKYLEVITAPGKYVINATYLGNDKYNPANAFNTFEVEEKVTTSIKIEVNPEYNVGDDVTIKVTTNGDNLTVFLNNEKINANYVFKPSKEGIYTIVARTTENATHYGAEKITTFTVTKKAASINVNGIKDVKVGEEITFTVTAEPGNAIVKINNKTINPTNGKYKFTPPTSGDYTLTVETEEDETYAKGFEIKTFKATKSDISISISADREVKVGEKATITVDIDADGIVEIDVDGTKYSLNVSDSKSLEVIMNKIGDMQVSAKYLGNERYNACDADLITIKVTDKTTPTIDIEVDPASAVVGDNVNIKVTTNGDNLIVTVLFDGEIKKAATGSLVFTPEKDGSYTIVARTSENATHYAAEKVTSFSVINKTKKAPAITVSEINNARVGEVLTFTVESNVAGAVVKINGEVIPPSRGSYRYTPQTGGLHVLTVETPEDGTYSKGLYTQTFDVAKKQSAIQISTQGDLTVDKNIRLIISSYDGAEIAVMMDGKEFNWQNTFKATAGEHLVVASVAENDQYLSNTTSYTFTVAKAKSSISVSGNQVILGQASTITVGLTNGATGMVTVNVGGTEYSINASKSKSLSVVLSKPGTYDISARYLGDEKYLPSESTSNTLIVEDKEKTTIDVYTPKEVNAGDNVEIEVVSNNNAIEVYFDGVKQTLKDDKFTVRNIKAGSHEIRVEGPETSELKSNATVSVFNADKQASEVTITLPKTISIGKDIVIEFSSYDGADITAVIDGVKQTLTGGKATLKATAGAHTIVASVDETDKYLASGANKTFNVDKLNSQIAVSGVDIAEGETSKITITTNVNEGIVIVNVADKQVAVDLAKAKSVDIELDTAGTYDLTANYLGTDIYKPSVAAKSTIKVQSKPAAKVDITIPDIKAGESKPISISIPNATGDVHVIVDGIDNVVTLDKDGKASYPLDNIPAGEHNVVVVYDDGVNDPAISSKSFNVSKQTAKAEITTPANVKEGENATVKVNIPGATGEVSVIVDGNEEKIALVNGAAEYQLNNVSGGEHSVVVIYPGDETHDSAYSASSFDVAKKPAVVKKASEFSDITIDDDLMISFILKDEDGNPIRDAVIKYNDGTEKTVKTDYHGQFRIQAVNNALISITYEGNAAITGTGTAFKLNVPAAPVSQKVETHFNIPDRSVTLTGYAVDFIAGEEGIYYSTTLLDANGKPVSNAYMEFAVNNKIYNRTTDAKGSFTPYKLNMIRAGRYTMAFNFAGNENYTNTFACVCVDLDKKPITIKAASKTFKASVKTKKYTVSLSTIVGSSHDGKIYLKSGKPVTLTVNGKKYTAQTNSKNKATFKIIGLSKKGTYDATIYFKGDKTYAEKEKTVKLTIS